MRRLPLILPPLTLAVLFTVAGHGAAPAPNAATTASAASRAMPQSGRAFENSLGIKFEPVKGLQALVGIWPVRVRDFQVFVAATNLRREKLAFEQGDTHPAVNVSWEDAQVFCRWLTQKEREEGRLGRDQSYRLPTDAEWSRLVGLNEPAGGTPQSKDQKIPDVYPWGSAWPPPKNAGNYDNSLKADTYLYTSPVGSFAPNAQGLYDLSGNVWQWCEDLYDASSGRRTVRGAAYYNVNADNLLLSRRNAYDPATRSAHIGFRLVLEVGGAAP